jgi:hypothetical protein
MVSKDLIASNLMAAINGIAAAQIAQNDEESRDSGASILFAVFVCCRVFSRNP